MSFLVWADLSIRRNFFLIFRTRFEKVRVRSEFQKDNAGGIMTNRGKEANSTNRPVREVVRGECDTLE